MITRKSNIKSSMQISLHAQYQKTTLPNRIRVVTEEIPYVRSVSIGVWVDVGSRDEEVGNNGITHFIEHMLFKGTVHYTNQQIARSLESVGGYLNAFTTKEHTCFYARVLDEHIPKAIDVLSDLVIAPVFPKNEIEKEKQVVLEELKNLEDDPDDLIHDYLDTRIYNKHPIGFPIIGNAQNIERFNRDQLFSHMQQHFTPQNIVVAAAGNLKHEEIVTLVDKYFKMNKRRSVPRVRKAVPKKGISLSDTFEKPIRQAYVCLGTLGYGIKDPMRYPLLLLNTLLGEGMSSRLFQNIREKYGFAYAVYSFVNMMSDTGSFGVYIGTDNQTITRSVDLIYKELRKLKSKPVGNSELKRTKAQMKGSMMLGLENMSNRMMRLGSGELYLGDYLSLEEVLRSIEAVTSDQIQCVANTLFNFDNFSTVIFKSKNETPS
jgi:predicted Zn-dependent peptidase